MVPTEKKGRYDMRFLTDRKEIAKALNFGKYPVIMFDLDSPKRGWDDVYEGTPVRVDMGTFSDGTRWLNDSIPTIYVDNNHEGIENTVMNRLKSDIHLPGGGAMLSESFGANDVIDMAKFAMAPIVKGGDDVVVVYSWEGGSMAAVRMMKVGKTSKHVTPIAMIRDAEEK